MSIGRFPIARCPSPDGAMTRRYTPLQMTALPPGSASRRGAWLTLANWRAASVEFAIESLYKLALAVPIIGGAFMVAVLLGADVRDIVGEGVRTTADLVIGSLTAAPVALVAFVAALG